MRATGDVLEICEDSSDANDQEHDDSDDGDIDSQKVALPVSDTVTFHSDPSTSSKQRKKKRVKKLTKSELSERRRLAQDRKLLGLVKPDVATNKEKERLLKRIATKGVVQLFNAVSERQRVLAEEFSKKMTSKERRETERRLQGSTFRVYSEANSQQIEKKELKDTDDEEYIKKEEPE
ncbi:hypothetical protein KIN20_020286 [Parelaphostrongylus tenuis]|uniref:RRP15-like protein n=1 Tax=Parelaphostrongylus tenuis TaxID=148309 RepID=A0AAD5QQQ2_PARTN|nr:hypothetical protein KIN20_020286 [Parelaphostrongylus tenuis]